jgi:acyl-CoA thioester hydrolase
VARQPIVYTGQYDVRFSDLDPYGHLNAKHYLDIVTSTRLQYSERTIGISMHEIAHRGIGFYLASCQQRFRKPIVGMATVKANSHVEETRGASFSVVYQITSIDETLLFSDGLMEFAIVDLKTQKPILTPDWVYSLFFHSY